MFKTYRTSALIFIHLFIAFTLSINSNAQQPSATASPQTTSASDPFKALQWRLIGPYRGGRVTAVTGVASQPSVFYFGATGGGVWKSVDGGINWEVISDNSVFGTGSVGAVGLSESD